MAEIGEEEGESNLLEEQDKAKTEATTRRRGQGERPLTHINGGRRPKLGGGLKGGQTWMDLNGREVGVLRLRRTMAIRRN